VRPSELDGASSHFGYISAKVLRLLNNASQLPQVWGRRSRKAFFVSDVQPTEATATVAVIGMVKAYMVSCCPSRGLK
jgi:hypothetical protein